jgi:hypothetical protein
VTTFLSLLLSLPVHAGFFVDTGETGYEFLEIPMAARASALGNSFTAMRADITAIDYNPAGLTGLERLDVNVGHQIYFEDSTLNAVAAGYPFYIPFLGPSRLGPTGEDAGNLTVGLQYKEFHANDDRRDFTGIPLGELTISDQLMQGTFAYDAGTFAVGASWKYIKSKLDQENRNNSAADVGVLFKNNGPLSIGASVLNIGPSKQFVTEKEPLPTTIRAGAAYVWRKWNFLTDVVQTRDKQTQPSLGAEWSANPYITLRAGGRYHTTFEPSGGIGIRFSNLGGDQPKKASPPPQQQASAKDGRRTLGQNPGAGGKQARENFDGSISFGLDYAIRSHETLGVVHTLTFKILY